MSLKVKTTVHVIKQSGTSLLQVGKRITSALAAKSVSGLRTENTIETYNLQNPDT